GDILNKVEKEFNFKDPSVHIPDLMKAYQLLQTIEDVHWKTIKSKELTAIIEACAGLYLEVSSETSSGTPNSVIKINIEALNRSNSMIELVSLAQTDGNTTTKNTLLKPNTKETIKANYTISDKESYTSAYWLAEKGTLGMYNVADKNLIGLPETPTQVAFNFNLKINNTPI